MSTENITHVNGTFWIIHFGADKGMKMHMIIQQVTAYIEHQYLLLVPSTAKLREFKALIIKRRSMMGVSLQSTSFKIYFEKHFSKLKCSKHGSVMPMGQCPTKKI